MKVYIVFQLDDPYCGNGYLLAVFDSHEKAEKYVSDHTEPYVDLDIVESEVM